MAASRVAFIPPARGFVEVVLFGAPSGPVEPERIDVNRLADSLSRDRPTLDSSPFQDSDQDLATTDAVATEMSWRSSLGLKGHRPALPILGR
jgi:hypothetical protein